VIGYRCGESIGGSPAVRYSRPPSASLIIDV
jgi:hypothetical protein